MASLTDDDFRTMLTALGYDVIDVRRETWCVPPVVTLSVRGPSDHPDWSRCSLSLPLPVVGECTENEIKADIAKAFEIAWRKYADAMAVVQ